MEKTYDCSKGELPLAETDHDVEEHQTHRYKKRNNGRNLDVIRNSRPYFIGRQDCRFVVAKFRKTFIEFLLCLSSCCISIVFNQVAGSDLVFRIAPERLHFGSNIK